MSTINVRQFSNGFKSKVKNKYVFVGDYEGDDVLIQFAQKNEHLNFYFPKYYQPKKGLHYNAMRITQETAAMLLVALNEYLTTKSPKP